MARFFSSDNLAWKPFDWAADILLLSGLWFVCSIPLVTMGAATCALYDCIAHCVRGNDNAMLTRFFRTFRRELFPAAASWLLWAAVIASGYWAIKAYGNSVSVTNASIVITTALLIVLSVVVGIACWVFPILSRFTFGFLGLNRTAVQLAIAHLPRTMLLGAATIVCGYFCLQFWIPFLFLPMLLVLLWSFLMEPVFQPFMNNENQ